MHLISENWLDRTRKKQYNRMEYIITPERNPEP